MPRKIYDLEEAEPDKPAIVKFMKETSNEIAIQRQHENKKIDYVRCADEKCTFFFDLGTNEQKSDAAQKHNLTTGHEVVMEYI